MKVAIDVSRMNVLNKTRGVGFYMQYLYESLKKYTDVDVSLVENEITEKFDVVHYPFFDLFVATLPIKKNTPTVVTVHDVIPLVFVDKYPKGIKGRINLERQKMALRNVQAVITDSQTSKVDIAEYLKFPENRIFSIYLAQAEQFKQIRDQKKLEGIRNKFQLPEKFALFVGNVNWNKNILNLTEAAISADIDLYLVGTSFKQKDNLDHPEMKSLARFIEIYSSHPKVHILGFVENDEVVGLLNLATVFLFPSFYEGFGLPILEAQACGVPVITSHTSSMLEVAKDSALLVDPENVLEIKKAILKVNDKKVREEFIKLGFKNIERFSWRKTAEETAQVYQKVYDQANH